MVYTYKYPRPMVTVDIILFSKNKTKEILFIKRKNYPYRDMWALPGGFVDINETIEQAAYRELKEETNADNIKLYQFFTFGDLERDPRGRNISIVYYGICDNNKINIISGDDAIDAKWINIMKIPRLAFDHNKIIDKFIIEFVKK